MDMMWYRRRGLMVTPHIESVAGTIASFNSDYNKIPIKSLICGIEPIQAGSGDPSPENVRPISGWAGVSVTKAGKNIYNTVNTVLSVNSGITVLGANEIEISNTAYQELKNAYDVSKFSSCVLSFECETIYTSDNASFKIYYDSSQTRGISLGSVGNVQHITLVIPNTVKTFSFGDWAYTGKVKLTNISLEQGSSATDYEPYKGSTYSVNWETEAGTVYGGYVDAVNGKLVVDRAMVTLDGTHYTLGGRNTFTNVARYYVNQDIQLRARGRDSLVMADRATPSYNATVGISNNTQTGYYIWVYSSNTVFITLPVDVASSNAEATAWLAENPIQFVYELATPTEIQLTQQEVKTLLDNNIWCDSGDVSVNYWKWGI